MQSYRLWWLQTLFVPVREVSCLRIVGPGRTTGSCDPWRPTWPTLIKAEVSSLLVVVASADGDGQDGGGEPEGRAGADGRAGDHHAAGEAHQGHWTPADPLREPRACESHLCGIYGLEFHLRFGISV